MGLSMRRIKNRLEGIFARSVSCGRSVFTERKKKGVHVASQSSPDEQTQRIAAHWDAASVNNCPGWWAHPRIVQHINQRVCGRPVKGTSRGAMEKVRELFGTQVWDRGVSVGCGNGAKEMAMIEAGIVGAFTLYELSPVRVEQGRALAESRGLGDRITFHIADAFTADIPKGSVDFVHWNNSLHHMMDTPAAVAWSWNILRKGGMFYMDDFIGPTRFQWSDKALELCTAVRASLPAKYLANPRRPDGREPVQVRRPDPVAFARQDPSEAADSDRIMPAVGEFFPKAWVMRTGGVIYNCALGRCMQNFDPGNPDDTALLDGLLVVDDVALEIPGIESHYAVALACK